MAREKRQHKQNPQQHAQDTPRDWKQIHPKFRMVMYHAGEWHEMACYECGINRSKRGAIGKKGLLDHINRQHGRYCDPNDMNKNEDDHTTLERCKQRRKFSEEDIERLKRGEQPDKPVTLSKVATKKPYKKSTVGAKKKEEDSEEEDSVEDSEEDEEDLGDLVWIDSDTFVPSI